MSELRPFAALSYEERQCIIIFDDSKYEKFEPEHGSTLPEVAAEAGYLPLILIAALELGARFYWPLFIVVFGLNRFVRRWAKESWKGICAVPLSKAKSELTFPNRIRQTLGRMRFIWVIQ
ncbi:hypothetical protein FJZ31_33565 [Candidatus Poribacteria bacterium]|nr:hypothetical protein [Candidatus Poribacteria bacterium]